MKPEVRSRWIAWSAAFEGRVPAMYLDQKGLVTCAVGNLIDTGAGISSDGIALPWLTKSGNVPATPEMIQAEFRRVKARQDLKDAGLGSRLAITTLYLDNAAIDALVLRKLDANDAYFRRHIPTWESWPYQAQMVRHSIAWACGEGEPYPKFEAACARADWTTAITECLIAGEATNRGLIARNAAQRELLAELKSTNAAPAPSGRGSPAAAPSPVAPGPAPEMERAAPAGKESLRTGWLEGLIARLLALLGRKV